ncbi:M48 family metallopeptidase [Baaleninema sp.]|uniref:M48 family metallopeptidase n=1 Tax=Baaleninema sp. TaxID=3101197 RepID=UPI003D07AF30
MSSSADRSQSSTTTRSLLKAGLASLKRKQYDRAIEPLQRVCQVSTHPKEISQAQMGLVNAYANCHRPKDAIELCRQLCQTPNPKVQQWAQQTLEVLTKRFPDAAEPEPLGFEPFETDETAKPQDSTPRELGFEPFDADETPPNQKSAPRQLGFEPLETASSSPNSPIATPREIAYSPEETPQPPPTPEPSAKTPATANAPGRESTATPETPKEPPATWQERTAPRARSWKPLKSPNLAQLRWLELGTVLATFVLLCLLLHGVMTATNEILVRYTFSIWRPIQAFYLNHTGKIAGFLLLLFAVSPWWLEGVLRFGYGGKPFSLGKLKKFSPEAAQSVRQFCKKRQLPIPEFRLLPDTAPVIFAYGHLPKTARIVVSQGLLDRLSEDEIAALVMGQVVRLDHGNLSGDLAVLSALVALLQLPYLLYWQGARLGDRLRDRQQRDRDRLPLWILWGTGFWTVATVSALAYGLYGLLRYPMLALSRRSQTVSDIEVANATGNPNGLTRALLSLSVGTAEHLAARPDVVYLYEGWELLAPLGTQQARFLGSLYPQIAPEAALAWALKNPYSDGFALNSSHPLLGKRLYRLTRVAQFWDLEPQLEWGDVIPMKPTRRLQTLFLVQSAPFFGTAIGVGLALVPVVVGWVAQLFDIGVLTWIYEDRWWLLAGLAMTGFAMGTLLRINGYFPDLKLSRLEAAPNWRQWFGDGRSIPGDSRLVKVSGRLVGRSGTGNWLGQDLTLHTDDGAIPLHYCSRFGSLGNFLPQPVRPVNFLDRSVTVTGWFRRGAIPWIDIDTLQTPQGKTPPDGHPIRSTVIAILMAVWGAYLLVRGGL